MAANNIVKIFFAIVAGLTLSCSSNSKASAGGEVISYLTKEVSQALAMLGIRIEECESMAARKSPPVLDEDRRSELGAGAEEILLAAAHFNHLNSFRCERDERMTLVYKLGALAAAQRQMAHRSDKESPNYEDLVFPPLEVYEYSLRYKALSAPLQNYFEEVFGGEPFDLSTVLDANANLIQQ